MPTWYREGVNTNRGFEGLATPTGRILVTLALLFLIFVVVTGGLLFRAFARADSRARKSRTPAPAEPAPVEDDTPPPA